MITVRDPILQPIPIIDLRPTQMTVGMHEVREKREHLRKHVAKKADFDAALNEMLDSDRPFVLDVLVPYQEHVLPMIPSGMTVKQIIKA